MGNKPLKILITSGGTSVMIDDMRCVTNISKGTFGKQIADYCVDWNASSKRENNYPLPMDKIILLKSIHAKSSIRIDRDRYGFVQREYFTFDEYCDSLKDICYRETPDIIVLAAAVSDYAPVYESGKISSDKDHLNLSMRKLPKIIDSVRGWMLPGTVICGFKMMMKVSEDELVASADKMFQRSKVDLVVANDYSTMKNPDHKIMILRHAGVYHYNRSEDNLAQSVIDSCIDEWREKNE